MSVTRAELAEKDADLARKQEIEEQNEALIPQVKQWIMEVLRENDKLLFTLYELADVINERHDVPLWQNWENVLIRKTDHGAAYTNPVDLRLECVKKALLELTTEGGVEYVYYRPAQDNVYGIKRGKK